MPYKSNEVGKVRKDIPSLKNFSDSKVRQFIKIFNSLLKDGMAEKQAIPLAISQINKSLINKATTESVSKDDAGNLVYRGSKFPGYNKPIRDSGDKQGKVLAKKGNEIKVVRFGDPSMPDNQSVEANDRFYARFGGQDGLDDKFSPLYWSAKWLWPKGSMKGKGAKEFHTLKKSSLEQTHLKEDSVSNKFISFIKTFIMQNKEDFKEIMSESEDLSQVVIKALNEDERIAIEVIYEPNTPDLHGQWMSEETVEKACENFNKNLSEGNVKPNLFHVQNAEDKLEILRTYIIPTDCYIGDTPIKKGTWIGEMYYKDEKLWELKKSGILPGVSIGAMGKVIKNSNEL